MTLTHRERLKACLADELTLDRPPVALWRHFPVDDQDPETLAAATLDYQRKTGEPKMYGKGTPKGHAGIPGMSLRSLRTGNAYPCSPPALRISRVNWLACAPSAQTYPRKPHCCRPSSVHWRKPRIWLEAND
jgi:hypothetical protein